MISPSDAYQIAGGLMILAGYWKMAKNVAQASLSLVIGCAIWAAWAINIEPRAWYLCALEVTLGIFSARTLWINRRNFWQ